MKSKNSNLRFLRPEHKFGLVIEPKTHALDSIGTWLTEQNVAQYGMVVVRGFDNYTVEMFRDHVAFIKTVFLDSTDPARTLHPQYSDVQTVTEGESPLNWHAENGIQPLRPDVLSLYRETAGTSGCTLVCDGVELWANLPTKIKNYFAEHRLEYDLTFDVLDLAKAFAIPNAEALDAEMLGAMIAHNIKVFDTDITITNVSARTLSGKWNPSCPTTTEGGTAFCSNVFRGVYLDSFVPKIEGGEPIPKEILAEIESVAQAAAVSVDWKEENCIVINNHRCLHGRTKPGAGRKVYVKFGHTGTTVANFQRNMQALLGAS